MNKVLQDSYQTYRPRPFKKDERENVTLLFGGLTWRAERALVGLFEGAGYKAESLPPATRSDLLFGRSLVDVGQCCPTAFTTGNLARTLKDKADKIGPDRVADEYVFVTAGACGACRFGQYHYSYELALRNIGMEAFRLFLVEQHEIDQSKDDDEGFQTDTHLLLGAILSVMMTDVIQDLEYQIRPYEVEFGATDAAIKKAVEDIYDAVRNRPQNKGKLGTILWHLTTDHYAKALRKAKSHFEGIKLDRLRIKPKVKITGEFYVSTVEGDANHSIHAWLEQEGAEVLPAPVAVWFDYLMRFARRKQQDRIGIHKGARKKQLMIELARRLYRGRYHSLCKALGDIPRHLPDQNELARLAQPFYDNRLNGGEGDLLVGKALYAHLHKVAHMVCELSPYGCLPNTMSIGAMAAAQGKYPDLLYAPLEIKGDSEVHVISRCQMVLTEAKARARSEFDAALKAAGLTLEEARARYEAHPEMHDPFWQVPKRGAVGTAANVVLELGGASL
ncbi:hypothetical protein [Actibacterium pelagium]|uniref:Activator of (R)-2-hydroxyglutaryl-CoA dehydratase n=1 Tax=Actibacterium pelagium TaxID=2029103 RepID=A0A917EL78_9RHOB|nr:hypothetical protein [Actibacterium pelagium]GGE50851.1 hypothetical protein GCM10011517_18270 [Actibacterium pelagium]